ncbi:MAG: hypothetical protein ACKVVP_03350 [Chloroflexota bacterium]
MTTQVRTESALDRFVRQTRDLFGREPDLDKRWAALEPMLSELLADPEVIEASRSWPDCVPADGRAENLIFYEDPDFKFAINGLVGSAERAGGNPRIHDHAHIYTLYGLMDGHQRIERFERLDDRSRPDYAEIREISSTICGPGEIDLVPPYEIHREIGIGERTVAVIIRSEKSGGFNQGRYVPGTNQYYESLGPRQTPWEMLPRK